MGELGDQMAKLLLEDSYVAAKNFYNIVNNEVIEAVASNNQPVIDLEKDNMKEAYNIHRGDNDELVQLAELWSINTES